MLPLRVLSIFNQVVDLYTTTGTVMNSVSSETELLLALQTRDYILQLEVKSVSDCEYGISFSSFSIAMNGTMKELTATKSQEDVVRAFEVFNQDFPIKPRNLVSSLRIAQPIVDISACLPLLVGHLFGCATINSAPFALARSMSWVYEYAKASMELNKESFLLSVATLTGESLPQDASVFREDGSLWPVPSELEHTPTNIACMEVYNAMVSNATAVTRIEYATTEWFSEPERYDLLYFMELVVSSITEVMSQID